MVYINERMNMMITQTGTDEVTLNYNILCFD